MLKIMKREFFDFVFENLDLGIDMAKLSAFKIATMINITSTFISLKLTVMFKLQGGNKFERNGVAW